MKIYGFVNGPAFGSDLHILAMTEDGRVVGQHVSSSPSWGRHDIGATSTWHHDEYAKACPGGFEVEWVDDPKSHPGCMAAIEKAKAWQDMQLDPVQADSLGLRARESQSRPERRATERYEYSIFEVCEALHMDQNGSLEGLPPETKAEYLAALKKRLSEWRDPIGGSWRYDNAVRELIEATIAEVREPSGVDAARASEEEG